jgi:hypothetical protein
MKSKSYPIEKDGPKRVVISWQGVWKNINVTFDGQTVGVIPNQKALSAGQDFQLVDGSQLQVKLVRTVFSNELRVLRNGVPLPGSGSDPGARLKAAYQMIYFIAGLNLVLGLVALFFQVELLLNMGIGFFSIAFGLVFLLLAFLTQRKSRVALILAIIIFTLDGLIGIIGSIAMGNTSVVGSLFVRIILLIPMVQGVGAIKTLKKDAAESVIAPVD